jgi:hypothetical protein
MVALFTPVIALAAGSAAAWLGDLGFNVDASEIEPIIIAAVAAVLAPAAQWLHGAQKYEGHQAELEKLALVADTQAAEQTAEAEMNAAGDYEDEDDGYYDDDDGYDGAADDDDDDYEAAREEQPAAF